MPKKILIADDNEDLRALLAYQLKAMGYVCVMAADGTQAVEQCVAEKPDLALLDVLMPGKDGSEVAAELRDNPSTRHIPVIFLTALVQGDEGIGSEEGNRYTLPKSVSVGDLVKKIEEILQK